MIYGGACGIGVGVVVSSSAGPWCDARSIRVPQQASFVRLAPLRETVWCSWCLIGVVVSSAGPWCDARSIRVPQQASFVRLAPLRAHPDSRVHVATSTAAAALGGEEGEASLLELPAAGTPMLLMVTVTAADGVTTSTYTITIQVRGAGYGFSN
jgi:hypothetical protein